MNIDELYQSQNIAADLDEDTLRGIGHQCLQNLQQDLTSREPWEVSMADAMKIAIQLTERKNTPWPNASNVKFPLLSIACIQFSSRVFPQLFATPRPVKMRVIGNDPDSAKHGRAGRVSEHMSYQCLEEDEDWLSEHDKLLITLPIMGSSFIKTFYDDITKSVHVHAKDLVVNYYAKSLETCHRYTHIIPMYRNEIIEKQRSKVYLDHTIYEQKRQQREFDKVSDDFQGKTEPLDDDDAPIDFYEQYCWLDLDKDGYKEPYTVVFDGGVRYSVLLTALPLLNVKAIRY